MKDQSFRIVKCDIDANSSIKIVTHHNFSIEEWPYIIFKNDKRIGWALTEETALSIHDMYARIHILHETDDDPNYDAMIKEMRSKPQNNGFLHDIPDELLAERKIFD